MVAMISLPLCEGIEVCECADWGHNSGLEKCLTNVTVSAVDSTSLGEPGDRS